MTSASSTTRTVWVAIDVAKQAHQVLIERPDGSRRAVRVANTVGDIDRLVRDLRRLAAPCEIAFEPTGDYHRAVMHRLGAAGFHLCQVSSVAVARTRDALFNSWDKNDPKDAHVILHLLKTGATQRYREPLVTGYNDLQEMANTYQQVSLRKVRLHHAILTHHLPMYFPEAERYLHSTRAAWFTELLLLPPCPAAVRQYSKADFIRAVGERVGGRKVDKARWLADFYETAGTSIGLPVTEDTEAIRMFRLVLEEYRQLCQRRKALEADVVTRLTGHVDFDRLQTVPGIGPILALIILAEARDLRRFWSRTTISEILWPRPLHRAVRPVSRDAASLEAWECATPVCLLDGGHGRRPYATKQLLPEVPGLHSARSTHQRTAPQGLHRGRREDGAGGVRRDHVRQRLSPLPGSDETRREDPFAAGRGGVSDDLVDNARTFHLDINAV